MPQSRLMVPVLPTLVLAAGFVLGHSKPLWGGARLTLALLGQLFVLWKIAPKARLVSAKRTAVIEQLAPVLASAKSVAALDIGWVGAATSATITDLAGVTDSAVAVLPGGHTSKRIPPMLLAVREVDTLVLLLGQGQEPAMPWTRSRFARVVEMRIGRMAGMRRDFRLVAQSRVAKHRYLVLRRRQPATTP